MVFTSLHMLWQHFLRKKTTTVVVLSAYIKLYTVYILYQCFSSTGIIFQYSSSSSSAARNILSQYQLQHSLFKIILVSISSSICCLKQFQFQYLLLEAFQLVLVLVFLVTNNNSLYQFWPKQFQLALQYLQFNKYVCHTTLLLQKNDHY